MTCSRYGLTQFTDEFLTPPCLAAPQRLNGCGCEMLALSLKQLQNRGFMENETVWHSACPRYDIIFDDILPPISEYHQKIKSLTVACHMKRLYSSCFSPQPLQDYLRGLELLYKGQATSTETLICLQLDTG